MAPRLSNWVNLQDMVKANEGNGQKMADNVYGQLEQQGDDVTKRLKTATTQFNSQAQQATNNAFSGINTNTAAGAAAAGAKTYTGPRELSQVDSGVGAAVGDAAQRINASQGAQYQAAYGSGAGAKGSAYDQLFMGQAGGDDRSAALKSKYGGLQDTLKGAMTNAQGVGDSNADFISKTALGYAGKVPQMKQDEERKALYKKRADIMAENRRRIAEYQAKVKARNEALQRMGTVNGPYGAHRNGSQLQSAYAIDYPEMLNIGPELGGAQGNDPFAPQFNDDGSPKAGLGLADHISGTNRGASIIDLISGKAHWADRNNPNEKDDRVFAYMNDEPGT